MFEVLLPHLITTMEYVRTFLESSSIAGFYHISTSRKGWRLFWIMVVTFGFCTAGFLIHESFKSWQESPIKTTIETVPISEMKFPKVTVCPPKDTYTDLNYNVMVADNSTQKIDTFDLYQYAREVLKNYTFMGLFDKLKDADGFYNWYHGYNLRGNYRTLKTLEAKYSLSTYATSGSISTPYFGEKFNPSLIDKEFSVSITIYPPKAVLDNSNIKLHLQIQKKTLIGLSKTSQDRFGIHGLSEDLTNEDNLDLSFNFSQTEKDVGIVLTRKITPDDLLNSNMDSMPGFNLTWWYTGAEVKPDDFNQYMNENQTILFRK